MSVMSCSRRSCPNIMCATYINDIGYICQGCQEEFISYLKMDVGLALPEYKMRKKLKEFMEIEPVEKINDTFVFVHKFFEDHTH